MEQKAIDILSQHRLMVIATLRPDGWPQATMVSYANEGLLIYFIISRASQKLANIKADPRVAIVVGRDFRDPKDIKALSIAAEASEVEDETQRARAIRLILQRHPALNRLPRPDPKRAAVMRAACRVVSILDYSKGLGHSDIVTVAPGGPPWMEPAQPDDWGFLPKADQPTEIEV
jgi:nitroimidazol reductase NimA-like FMN-containing flavoprotein (pyridoxamine 5'-phosphate oxidase superfamily)